MRRERSRDEILPHAVTEDMIHHEFCHNRAKSEKAAEADHIFLVLLEQKIWKAENALKCRKGRCARYNLGDEMFSVVYRSAYVTSCRHCTENLVSRAYT